MINLLKNVARSFKKNKLSICGLSFLVFLSVGIYTALSGTTSAINKEYKWILKEGNLHDFTVSELYNVGVVRYSNNVEKFKGVNGEDIPSCLYNDNLLSKINIIDTDGTIIETVIAPYVTITGTRTNANVSISYTVDVSNCDDNASLKNFYLDSWISHLNNPSSIDTWTNHIEYLQPTISYQIKNLNVKTFAYFTACAGCVGCTGTEVSKEGAFCAGSSFRVFSKTFVHEVKRTVINTKIKNIFFFIFYHLNLVFKNSYIKACAVISSVINSLYGY